jgi:uncharacterized protein (DUF2344 family)
MSILFSLKLPRDMSNEDIQKRLNDKLPTDIKLYGKLKFYCINMIRRYARIEVVRR